MTLYEILRDAAKVARDAGRADLHEKIIELIGKMGEMAEQNANLREENARLRDAANLREEMRFEHPFYVRDGWPHCANCYDSVGRAIRLTDIRRWNEGWLAVCLQCEAQYETMNLPAGVNPVRPETPRSPGVASVPRDTPSIRDIFRGW